VVALPQTFGVATIYSASKNNIEDFSINEKINCLTIFCFVIKGYAQNSKNILADPIINLENFQRREYTTVLSRIQFL
jgi:hypothetical protein